MRKLALFATLAAVVLAHTGCARWTLRPMHAQRNGEDQPMPEKLGSLSSLMKSQASPPASGESQEDLEARSPELGLDKIPADLALARLNERQGDERKAEDLYRAYIVKDPTHPLPYHRLGVMAARKSKLDEAEQHLRKALEVSPPSVDLLGDIGYLCYLQSRFDEAEHYLLQALEQAPDNKPATNNLALVYEARGDFDKSLRYFSRVNDDAKSHANVAFTMTQRGHLEDARNEYLTALSIDKTLRSAANALVQIETKRKAAEAAAKRNGRQPTAPVGNDGVIELSSTRDQQLPAATRSQEAPASAPRFEPVARTQPVNASAPAEPQPRPLPPPVDHLDVAATAPSARPIAVDNSDRLMPLPALPAMDNQSPAPNDDGFAAHGTVAPLSASNTDDSTDHAPRQLSRFTTDTKPSPAPADIGSQVSRPMAQAEEIFSQARQVSWDAASQPVETARTGFGNIPIPTTEPLMMHDGVNGATASAPKISASGTQPAIAVEAVKPETPKVRPAVHLGLSDASASATATKLATPVKSQFSDFGTAPARINISSTASPLGSQR